MTDIKNLMPKHGETFALDLDKPAVMNAFVRLKKCKGLLDDYFFMMAYLPQDGQKITIPCKSCFVGMAVLHEEIAALLREVAGDKIQVPTGKHDGG